MKVKAIGGIFIRTSNINDIKKWYQEVLNINFTDWNGMVFNGGSSTVFALFNEESHYYPKEQSYMLNFQIENMDDALKHLQKLNIKIVKEMEVSKEGKFITIQDPLGNWLELWEGVK